MTQRRSGSSKGTKAPGIVFGLLALTLIGLLVTWGMSVGVTYGQPTTSTEPVEPKAGTWKTWVLTSGSELRPPAPPANADTQAELKQLHALVAQRDATALDQMAFWDTGAPSYRWSEMLVEEALKNNLPTPLAGRHLAVLHVAIYDAMVAAWDAKYAYNRPRPSEVDPQLQTVVATPHSPSYPSEHAVAAGAAATVLTYIFPNIAGVFADKAEEAGRSRLLAGVQYPSDVAAGLALGRAVAARVIERAKTDGTDAQWTGTVPTGPGYWNGTNPILPLGGTWKTWVLTSGSEFRPGPPPAYDSAQKTAELEELKTFKRTPKTDADAFFWQYGAGVFNVYQYWNELTSKKLFEYRLDANPPRAARACAIANIAFYDAFVACWDAKYTYWAIRPFQLDPTFKTLFPTPNHPSYPAAHGCLSTGVTTALGYLFPRDAAALKKLSDEAAESRIWAGIHYRSDVVAGIDLGRKVAEKIIERARSDGAQ
jgi:membrane-associated phospholipid phosphatase